MEEVTTPETLPDALDVGAADGGGADQTGSISLDALTEVLGKDFKDTETALKAVKDTFNYVGDTGKVKALVAEARTRLNTDDQGVLEALSKLSMEPTNEVAAQPQAPQDGPKYLTEAEFNARLEEAEFFSKNSSYSEIKDVLAPLKEKHGANMSWSEFAASDVAKKVIDPFVGYTEAEAKKSVLESNPRLGAANDRMTSARTLTEEARKAAVAGDVAVTRQTLNAAKNEAVSAVIEAYELK